MEALIPALADFAIPKITDAIFGDSSQPDNMSSSSSQTTAPAILDSKLAVNRPLPLADVPQAPTFATSDNSSLIIPFQFAFHTHGADEKFSSVAVRDFATILSLTEPYRLAQLVELDLVICPSQKAVTVGSTIHAAWTPAYLTLDKTQVLSVYGAQNVTFGGTFHTGTFTIPADLSVMNPIIKSPVSYSDTPRITLISLAQPSAGKDTLCLSYIRGKVKLSHPSLQIGAAYSASA